MLRVSWTCPNRVILTMIPCVVTTVPESIQVHRLYQKKRKYFEYFPWPKVSAPSRTRISGGQGCAKFIRVFSEILSSSSVPVDIEFGT